MNLLLKALSWVNCLLSYMYEEEDDDPLIKGIILIGCVCIVGVIVAGVFAIIHISRLQYKCPHCSEIGLEKVGQSLLKVEPTSKIERLKRYDRNGNVIGSREHRIYGKRETYKVEYRCNKCGKTCIKEETNDIY